MSSGFLQSLKKTAKTDTPFHQDIGFSVEKISAVLFHHKIDHPARHVDLFNKGLALGQGRDPRIRFRDGKHFFLLCGP